MDSSVTPAYQSQRRQGDLPYLDASFTAAFANISALAIRITSVDGANGFLNAPVSVKYQPQNGVSQRSATATPYLLLPPPPRFCFPAQPPPTPASSASASSLSQSAACSSARPTPARPRSPLDCCAAPPLQCSQSVGLGVSAGAFTVRVGMGKGRSRGGGGERVRGAVQSVWPAKVLLTHPIPLFSS